MGCRGAKAILGLMVMALAFSTMAPANATTPGEICIKTNSGLPLYAELKWEWEGNRSNAIATDSNGCANFPHLPRGVIDVYSKGGVIQYGIGLSRVRYYYGYTSGDLSFDDLNLTDSSSFYERDVVVDSSTVNLIPFEVDPVAPSTSTINVIQKNGMQATHAGMWPLATGYTNSYGDDSGHSLINSWLIPQHSFLPPGEEHSRSEWSVCYEVVDPESASRSCSNEYPYVTGSTYNFRYVGNLVRDPRNLPETRFNPDTGQTENRVVVAREPVMRIQADNSITGISTIDIPIVVGDQTITVPNAVVAVAPKNVKFKKGKPVKVKVKLLDSNGKAWKKRKVYANFDGATAKNSSKCRNKLESKTNSKGFATFTLCPKSAGTISYNFGWWDPEINDWSAGFVKGSTNVKKSK
jgi:hypothetical protein